MVTGPGEPVSDTVPIAYAGEPGAFGEDALLAAFGDVPRTAVATFRDVFTAVVDGSARAGVLPIENLLNGTVREVYDLLLAHELEILAEAVVPVRLCLGALPGQTLDEIERVYSHVQALAQAEVFLRSRPWTTLTSYTTAGAGKLIAERGERGAAAVLSPRAAARFGLSVLAEDIQGGADNRTRFLVVAPPQATDDVAAGLVANGEMARRTTVAFAVRNEPGTLLVALRAFADRGVNLSSLESRPSRTAAWEYVFWVDIDAGLDEPACASAIAELRRSSTLVRILGSYPRAEPPAARRA